MSRVTAKKVHSVSGSFLFIPRGLHFDYLACVGPVAESYSDDFRCVLPRRKMVLGIGKGTLNLTKNGRFKVAGW